MPISNINNGNTFNIVGTQGINQKPLEENNQIFGMSFGTKIIIIFILGLIVKSGWLNELRFSM